MSRAVRIELRDLSLDDHIDLTAPRVPRWGPGKPRQGQVVKMEGGRVILGDPLLRGRPGAGHHFRPCSHTQMTGCDLCGGFIWGLYKQSLRCTYCRFTCHYRCRAFVQSDCIPYTDQSDFYDGVVEKDTNVDEDADWGKSELSVSEAVQKVKEYNVQINGDLPMVLNRDGSYRGFIKVHVRLDGWSVSQNPKQLHISSCTCVCEVIQALLPLLGQAQAPRVALYAHTRCLGHERVWRLGRTENPLLLRLCAGPGEDSLRLELQEHPAQINWDAFALPELDNFLRILRCEEERRVRQIVQRYGQSRLRLQGALECSAPG
ncbi:ras association domain-containing protein 1-like [Conger conger]|uniref:ras association domain-containing protein 1-like n=1 Tax=Conger conger TaxID=82655 RepID=UPI002A5A32F9|nr:ras association domain-containing protein 1-like [Conger conger]